MNERWEFIEFNELGQENLDKVGQILLEDPGTNVHVSIYKNDDQGMAQGRVRHIKNYIIKKYQVESDRIHTSWFRCLEK